MNTAVALLMIGTWLAGIAAVIASVAAWITHVVVCIKTASWILLLFGCVVAPVGVIHGVGVWLGVF
ncbi:hypothetical protein [Mesorhizobium sp.]|uniref:hypothetical protein n=1 Tax=Mesorhizobium sp. TaxID=1871066 RepID=UPI000FE72597|nr:hypothetical protein [Mesorhizobium sp.]RWI35494.1 MAG: hypothetical protein EOR14_28745 [Mesorhizobium sp.]RWJ66337.1 MAG: hypothetical protein EOR34_28390 [Mesorhizobium sp.]